MPEFTDSNRNVSEDAQASERTHAVSHSSDSHTLAELMRANQRLRLMTQITRPFIGAASISDQWHELATQARTAFDADACVIRALEGDQLRLLACTGIPREQLPMFLTAGWGISGQIVASRQPLLIQDTRQDAITAGEESRLPNSYQFRAYVGAPLLVEEQVVGLMGIYSLRPYAFSEQDREHLRIVADHVAVGIANENLYRQLMQQKELLEREIALREAAEQAQLQSLKHLQASLEGTVRAMSSVVEMRDPYTAGHQRRVAALSCAMAAHFDIAPEEREALRIAGLLHDIGKISVPAEILCKPGQLSPPEWRIIQTHAQVGYDILRGATLPEVVPIIALQHHERLDGSGYPHHLQADAIHPLAQLLAVADVVEAMGSDRPYRAGLPIEAALAEIMEHRGVRYQPEAVDACLAVLAQHEYELEPVFASEG